MLDELITGPYRLDDINNANDLKSGKLRRGVLDCAISLIYPAEKRI